MNVLQNASSHHQVQVTLHQLKDQVQVFVVESSNDGDEFDDVFVSIELLQVHDFSVGSLSIGGVLESVVYFLESHQLIGLLVSGLPNYSVGSFAQFLENFILFLNVIIDFITHFN